MKRKTLNPLSFSILLLLIILEITGCGPTNINQQTVSDTGPTETIVKIEQAEPGYIEKILANLRKLSIDECFEESFKQMSLRYPESLVELGVDKIIGLEEVVLNDISDDYIRETQQIESGILEILRSYERDSLPLEHQVSYDVYEWYLDDLVRGHEFMYYDYPATFFITSVHVQTENFFSANYPIRSKQDAEDYVTRLSLVRGKFEQLIEGLKLREKVGVIPPQFAIYWALSGISNIANSEATQTSYYTAFVENVKLLEDIDNDEIDILLSSAIEAITNSVIPAYQNLQEHLNSQLPIASKNDGLWQFENGAVYYDYLLRHHTSVDLTADEIHELGLEELERIHAEIRKIFDQLGYPEDETLHQLYQRVAQDGGIIPGDQMIDTYEAIIEEAYQNLEGVFSVRPQAEVVVIGVPSGGYYVQGSVDGSRPGAFYATVNSEGRPYYQMITLAYHETIPGHHFQISLAAEMDLPTFRKFVVFNGYAEGWALYTEKLASELGWYEGDPYGDLGRLQDEAFRAARLVVDTGIHAKGWNFDQAVEFLIENVGFERTFCEYQIARYIVYPAQATSYKLGMIKILELRQMAMDLLGDQFDLIEFHNVVLSNGSLPLAILEEVVNDYINEKLAEE